MSAGTVLFTSAAAVACFMLAIWVLSLIKRDVSIVDIGWGAGFVLVAWTCVLLRRNSDDSWQDSLWLLPLLTTIWGIRLSSYLFWRNHGRPEDYRYQQMREHWGASFPWVSLLTVFSLQGAIMWIVSLPIQMAFVGNTREANWLTLLGLLLWTGGLFFEAVGDWQLARFKANPENKGRVLDAGLWRYTRHPNYFGDFLVWWGLFCMAVSLGAPGWTIVSPLLMSFLLMRVSGVTLLERSLVIKKPEYASYIARTSAFFPRPPRGGSA